MPANRTTRRRRGLLTVLPAIVVIAACGGDDQRAVMAGGSSATDWSAAAVAPDPEALVQPSVATSPLTVGRNRIAFGLVGSDGLLVSGAEIDARFFSLSDAGEGRITGSLVAERSLTAVDLPQGFDHRHADGTDHDHSGPTATVYATEIEFPRPEWWGAELTVVIDGERLDPMKVPFRVAPDAPEPAFGEIVPPIEQLTIDDVDDIGVVDSADPPHPEWHDITVAAALELERPLVIAFATAAFCQTRFCGPVIEGVVGPLAERYGGEAEFIVIEPFDLEAARRGDLVPAPVMAEWGLDSEPWIFVTDAGGRVVGKFQGITSEDEVGAALEGVLDR